MFQLLIKSTHLSSHYWFQITNNNLLPYVEARLLKRFDLIPGVSVETLDVVMDGLHVSAAQQDGYIFKEDGMSGSNGMEYSMADE